MPKRVLELTEDGAYKYVLDMLGRGDRTESEVRKKLKEKGFSLSDRNGAVARAKDNYLLSDEKYALRYVDIYSHIRGVRRLRTELTAKGISASIIDTVLADIDDETDACKGVAEKFLRGKKRDEKLRDRLFRHLVQRGFAYTEIKQVLEETLKCEAEDLDEFDI